MVTQSRPIGRAPKAAHHLLSGLIIVYGAIVVGGVLVAIASCL